MSSLKQYLDLYESNRDTIDAHSAPAINSLRRQAWERLAGARLPQRGDEGYERISIDGMMAPDFGVNIARMALPVDPSAAFRCDVPALSPLMALVVNDTFTPTSSLQQRLPDGVECMSLRKAAELHPELVASRLKIESDNAAAQLNTLLLQDGVWIRVGRGVKAERPLQIVNLFSSPVDLMAVRRIVIEAEEDSECRVLVCDHTQDAGGERRFMSLQVVQIHAARGAKIEYCDLEESNQRTSRYSIAYASVDDGAQLKINGTTLCGGTTRNEYHIELRGTAAEARLTGMVTASEDQMVDNASFVHHTGTRTHSDQLFKYVLDGRASGAFEGSIVVDEGAVLTQAYQSNRNILASETARMHTRPQLEIYCDDVKCSHGAATGQLDQNALFYMQTRGIPRDEARMLLMQAFMADVIDSIDIPGLSDRLRHLVERRLSGRSATCAGCSETINNCNESTEI